MSGNGMFVCSTLYIGVENTVGDRCTGGSGGTKALT